MTSGSIRLLEGSPLGFHFADNCRPVITPYHIVTVNGFFIFNFRVPRSDEENEQIQKFGGNVRRERMARGMTQERLADTIGLNIRNLQKIEAGETNVLMTTVVRIRKALNCSADALLPKR